MIRFLFVLGACALVACDSGPCANGSCDAGAPDAPSALANMNASVATVVLDPGDTRAVVVTLDRGTVTGNIAITVQGLPPGVSATPLTIMPGSSAGKLNLVADPSAATPEDADATIYATAGNTLTAPIHVRVGSPFHAASANESFVVPATLTSMVIEAWGAGGGGAGGAGGGGGFATATVDVTPGETLTIVVGAGGPAGVLPIGAAGGAYSAVLRGSDVLVIAGGGGGAGAVAGGGGGGANGENGSGACGGGGATDAGPGVAGGPGASDGVALDGGAGASSDGGGGGSGGSGWFGGGGGGLDDASTGCGGGGGSAFATQSGSSVTMITASGQNPAGTSMPGYADAGSGLGGNSNQSGAAGLVVLAYPK